MNICSDDICVRVCVFVCNQSFYGQITNTGMNVVA